MKKLLPFLFLLTSCSSVVVYSPKTVTIKGDSKEVLVSGSDLKENGLDQKADGKLELPMVP